MSTNPSINIAIIKLKRPLNPYLRDQWLCLGYRELLQALSKLLGALQIELGGRRDELQYLLETLLGQLGRLGALLDVLIGQNVYSTCTPSVGLSRVEYRTESHCLELF